MQDAIIIKEMILGCSNELPMVYSSPSVVIIKLGGDEYSLIWVGIDIMLLHLASQIFQMLNKNYQTLLLKGLICSFKFQGFDQNIFYIYCGVNFL